ncbi:MULTISPECIES: hypothetical protein [unclassified Microcoleus]|uniref:hypothetical protein n=1 Tax=unclassified Microcoleus TaxID=2642155 RepID=UPI002FD225A9
MSIHLLILARDVLCGNRPIGSIEVLKVSIARSRVGQHKIEPLAPQVRLGKRGDGLADCPTLLKAWLQRPGAGGQHPRCDRAPGISLGGRGVFQLPLDG